MKAAAYLHFNDNAREAIETYREVFRADVVCEYPYEQGMTDDSALLGKVFHAELKIGDLNLYLGDTGNPHAFKPFSFVVELQDESEARRILEGLSRGGKMLSDFQKQPFGPTIARVEDRFGLIWDVVIC